MLFKGKPGVLKQMMDAYEETGGNVIAVEEVPDSEVSSYGVIARGEGPDNGFRITDMVEKPKREEAPSNLIISGRYILQPEIFTLLADQPRGAGGEIQLTDAMQTLMQQPALHRRQVSRARASIAAPRSAFSPPMSSMRSTATTSATASSRNCASST